MKQIRTVIFDFDGTLVDSIADVLACLKQAFDRCGIKANAIDPEKIMQFQVQEAVRSMSPGISADQTSRVIAAFREIYDAIDYPNTTLMPTVAELLPGLKAQAIGMHIVSNKRHVPTLRILDKFNIRRFFADIFNPDMPGLEKPVPKAQLLGMLLRKHAIEAGGAAYVGDSEVDVTAAQENSLRSISVSNGYGRPEGFSARPDYAIHQMIDLLEIIG